MTIRELAKIIRNYRERQQEPQGIQFIPRDEVRARELLRDLMVAYNTAYDERKKNWFHKHPNETTFDPNYDEELKDITLNEWVYYFLNRISMTPHQRYFETLAVGGSEEEAIAEKNKTELDILNDYRNYQDFNMVQRIWKQQQ